MLPSIDDVAGAYVFMRRRFGWRRPLQREGIEEALREAAALAGGRAEDEPAALLFALMRRPMDLGDAEELPVVLVEMLIPRLLGVEVALAVDDPEVRRLRARILARDPARRATFDDVRAFLAARLPARE